MFVFFTFRIKPVFCQAAARPGDQVIAAGILVSGDR